MEHSSGHGAGAAQPGAFAGDRGRRRRAGGRGSDRHAPCRRTVSRNAEDHQSAHDLERSLDDSNRLLAIRNFDRGQASFEKEEIGPGLLWMVESWRSAVEAGDPVWQQAARANLAAWCPHHARLKAVFSHDGPVDAAAFSPDGKTILTGGDDCAARLWDVASGRAIGQPLFHQGTVFAVAYRPDGKAIVTGSADTTARLWDPATGKPMGSPMMHGGEVRAVAFSPDGKTVVTGGMDHAARSGTPRPASPSAHHSSTPHRSSPCRSTPTASQYSPQRMTVS